MSILGYPTHFSFNDFKILAQEIGLKEQIRPENKIAIDPEKLNLIETANNSITGLTNDYGIYKKGIEDVFRTMFPVNIGENWDQRETVTGQGLTPLHVCVQDGANDWVDHLLNNVKVPVRRDYLGRWPHEMPVRDFVPEENRLRANQAVFNTENFKKATKEEEAAQLEAKKQAELNKEREIYNQGIETILRSMFPNVMENWDQRETVTGQGLTPLHVCVQYGANNWVDHLVNNVKVPVRKDYLGRWPHEMPGWKVVPDIDRNQANQTVFNAENFKKAAREEEAAQLEAKKQAELSKEREIYNQGIETILRSMFPNVMENWDQRETVTGQGLTPLHVCVQYGAYDLVEHLLRNVKVAVRRDYLGRWPHEMPGWRVVPDADRNRANQAVLNSANLKKAGREEYEARVAIQQQHIARNVRNARPAYVPNTSMLQHDAFFANQARNREATDSFQSWLQNNLQNLQKPIPLPVPSYTPQVPSWQDKQIEYWKGQEQRYGKGYGGGLGFFPSSANNVGGQCAKTWDDVGKGVPICVYLKNSAVEQELPRALCALK